MNPYDYKDEWLDFTINYSNDTCKLYKAKTESLNEYKDYYRPYRKTTEEDSKTNINVVEEQNKVLDSIKSNTKKMVLKTCF
jgi:hypothetical protein